MSSEASAQKIIADGVANAIRTAVDADEGQAYVPELVRIFRNT